MNFLLHLALAHKDLFVGSLITLAAEHSFQAVDYAISNFRLLQSKFLKKEGLSDEQIKKIEEVEASAAQRAADDLNKPAA